MTKIFIPLAALALASFSSAQVLSLGQTEDVASSGINTPLRNAPRAYQAYYSATNFSSVTTPTVLDGIAFRLAIGENWRPVGYTGSTWPDAPLNFSDFTIELSRASTAVNSDGEFISLTPTFAANRDASSVVQVRTGALSIPTAAFSADGGATGVHSFSAYIPFSSTYTLDPGEELVVSIRHTGYGATGTPLQAFFASGEYENGVADAVSSTSQGTTFAAAPNGFSSPLFVQFRQAQAVPEPATMAALGLGAAALLRRRRRQS